MTFQPFITAYTCVSAVGRGRDALKSALISKTGGLTRYEDPVGVLDTYVGRVDGLDMVAVPNAVEAFDCRNNRLAELTLRQDGFETRAAAARKRYGPERIGVVLGTSTSGIASGEDAFLKWSGEGPLPPEFEFEKSQDLYSLSEYVRRRLDLRGPSYTISAACASSTKTFIDGAQLIQAGLCDAVIVGGVDTLCETSLRGFNALQLLSPVPCRPNDVDRQGICIGEAGGFALLEREHGDDGPALRLTGFGESSDAHHMSSPHPEGLGARMAMEQALQRAALTAAEIGYVNMHGTGSLLNDRVEDRAIADVLGPDMRCSSTKGWTGHTLGAAGAVEAAIVLISLEAGIAPANLNLETLDPDALCRPLTDTVPADLVHVLTNNFGFGGNNCSLLFSREDRP
ncbi:MAG: beta-ketoacyl-[acyl-carrier-protein] synthase family protein [Alphaproteobacteria bacterium]|nr:beta-ketoacyl-[acyl-carrier-protein] synthase family protein [Alphaproteobacteria bacterium]